MTLAELQQMLDELDKLIGTPPREQLRRLDADIREHYLRPYQDLLREYVEASGSGSFESLGRNGSSAVARGNKKPVCAVSQQMACKNARRKLTHPLRTNARRTGLPRRANR